MQLYLSNRFSPTEPFRFFDRINTFDESFRASRQTWRHGFNLWADSNRFPQARPRCVHTSTDLCTHTHIRAKVDPPTGRRTLIQNRQYLPRSLVHSLNPSVSRPSIPLSLSFSPWPRSYRARSPLCAINPSGSSWSDSTDLYIFLILFFLPRWFVYFNFRISVYPAGL